MRKLTDYENELLRKAKEVYYNDGFIYMKFAFIFDTVGELLRDIGITISKREFDAYNISKVSQLNSKDYFFTLDGYDHIKAISVYNIKKELNDLADEIEENYKILKRIRRKRAREQKEYIR